MHIYRNIYLLTLLVNNIDHSLSKSVSIFLISLISNTFSGISGGGAGLLQLPALILFGVPYYQALASHKLATVALGIALKPTRIGHKPILIVFENPIKIPKLNPTKTDNINPTTVLQKVSQP